MKFNTFAMLFLAVGSLQITRATAAPSAQQIVEASDRVRNPVKPFQMRNHLTEFIDGVPRSNLVLVVRAKEDSTTGQYKNLVRYLEPARDSGKAVLMNGSTLWFYDPASKASVRISPQQRLIGQAAEGDVVSVNFGHDYHSKIIGEENLLDAERKQRSCWHLSLLPAKEEAVYGKIEYWVEKETNRPIKGKFYSDSGRLLKIAYYHHYETLLGEMRPTVTTIIDAVNPHEITTMQFSDYRFMEIPEALFQRDYLSHLTVE